MSNPLESKKQYESCLEMTTKGGLEGKYDRGRAIQLLQKAIELDPKNIYAYVSLAYEFRILNRYKEAESIAHKGLNAGDLTPAHKKSHRSLQEDIKLSKQDLWNQLGYTYADQEKYIEAEDAFKKAISIGEELGGKNVHGYVETLNEIRSGKYQPGKYKPSISKGNGGCFSLLFIFVVILFAVLGIAGYYF